jgi:hypothetical protein
MRAPGAIPLGPSRGRGEGKPARPAVEGATQLAEGCEEGRGGQTSVGRGRTAAARRWSGAPWWCLGVWRGADADPAALPVQHARTAWSRGRRWRPIRFGARWGWRGGRRSRHGRRRARPWLAEPGRHGSAPPWTLAVARPMSHEHAGAQRGEARHAQPPERHADQRGRGRFPRGPRRGGRRPRHCLADQALGLLMQQTHRSLSSHGLRRRQRRRRGLSLPPWWGPHCRCHLVGTRRAAVVLGRLKAGYSPSGGAGLEWPPPLLRPLHLVQRRRRAGGFLAVGPRPPLAFPGQTGLQAGARRLQLGEGEEAIQCLAADADLHLDLGEGAQVEFEDVRLDEREHIRRATDDHGGDVGSLVGGEAQEHAEHVRRAAHRHRLQLAELDDRGGSTSPAHDDGCQAQHQRESPPHRRCAPSVRSPRPACTGIDAPPLSACQRAPQMLSLDAGGPRVVLRPGAAYGAVRLA